MKDGIISKAVAGIAIMLAMSTEVQAKIFCNVNAEEKPNEYSKIVAQKVLEFKTGDTELIHQDETGHYYVNRNSDGTYSLTVADMANRAVTAAAIGAIEKSLVVMAPNRRVLGCYDPLKAWPK